jgi:hypothetical protein
VLLIVQQESAIFLRAGILLGVGLLLYFVNFAAKRVLYLRNPEAR